MKILFPLHFKWYIVLDSILCNDGDKNAIISNLQHNMINIFLIKCQNENSC